MKKNWGGLNLHLHNLWVPSTTKPLGHQNCKWVPVLSFLAWFTGRTGELRNGCFFHLLFEKKSVVLTLAIKLSADAGYYNIHCVDTFLCYLHWGVTLRGIFFLFLVTWGVPWGNICGFVTFLAPGASVETSSPIVKTCAKVPGVL